MTKQEEIRKGIPYCDCGLTGGCEKCQPLDVPNDAIVIRTESIDEIIEGALVDAGSFYLGNRDGDKDSMAEVRRIARQLKQDLHSQGVVIKVNEIKEVSTTASEAERFYAQGGSIALISSERTAHIFKALKEAGYVAVEPLIKEGE